MDPLPRHHTRRTLVAYAATVLTVLMSAALLGAAALVPAPPEVLPLVALVCIGSPMLAVWELASSRVGAGAGRPRLQADAIADLRRVLDQLPETHHPHGY